MKLKIGDENWTIKLLSQKDFASLFQEGEALTDTTKKTIYFIKEKVAYSTVAHELFHSYFNLSLISSTNQMIAEDVEEVCAEVLAKYLDDYYLNCKKVNKWLKKQLIKKSK